MAKNVKSTVKLNMPVVRRLTAAAQVSLAQTAEAIHTDVVQRQVMPRDTGTLQNESTFVYTQDIANGKVELISARLMQEDCTIIRNTTSTSHLGLMKAVRGTRVMPMQKADGLMITLKAVRNRILPRMLLLSCIRGMRGYDVRNR